jgi:hypothetical protein
MKRYFAFWYNNYYPDGGFNDFISSHDNTEEAKTAIMVKDRMNNNYNEIFTSSGGHVYDSIDKKIVWDSDNIQ